MIRRLPVVLIAASLFGAAQPALAADALSSSYWDAAYLNAKVDTGGAKDLTPEGFRLAFGLGLAKFLNFTADYDQHNYPNGREGFGSAGIWYHNPNPVWQWHAGASYERVEGDGGGSYEEEGYGVEVGIRYAIEDFELHAAYRYLDFGKLDQTDIDFKGGRYGLGGEVQLCPWWSFVADYKVREHKFEASGGSATAEYNEFTVGFRHYFATETDRLNRHGGVLPGLFSGDEPAAE